MKNIQSLLFLLAAGIVSSATLHAQGIKNLENNNGFKKHKLASKYDKVYGMKSRTADGADKVVINYTTDKIGDIPVKLIELYYVNDTLSKIMVHVSPENYSKLIEACKNSFGPPTYNLSNNATAQGTDNDAGTSANTHRDQYIWKAKKFSMEYYYSYPKFGGANATSDLYLSYTLNDYSARLQRVKKGNYSAKDF